MTNVVDIVGTTAQSFNIGNVALTVDSETGALESSIGYGFKNSKYLSNAVLTVKEPLSNSGLTITLHTGTELLISNGRDTYNSTTNPNGKGTLKSIHLTLSSNVSTTLTALGTGVEKTFAVFYNNDNSSLVTYEEKLINEGKTQPDHNEYTVWRDTTNNLFYVYANSAWSVSHIVKVGTVKQSGSTISSITPVMPVDLVKINDYVNGSTGNAASWQWTEIAASESSTLSITLTGTPCTDKNNLIIMVEGIQIPNSAYTLDSTGLIVSFTEAVPPGLRIVARYL